MLFSNSSDACLALWRLPFYSLKYVGGKKKKKNLSGVESFQHLLQKASRAIRCFWCERAGGVTVVLRCTTAGPPSPSARFSYTSEEGFCTSNKGPRVIFQSRTSKSVAHANIFPSVQNLKSQRPFCWLGLASFQWITAPFFVRKVAGWTLPVCQNRGSHYKLIFSEA